MENLHLFGLAKNRFFSQFWWNLMKRIIDKGCEFQFTVEENVPSDQLFISAKCSSIFFIIIFKKMREEGKWQENIRTLAPFADVGRTIGINTKWERNSEILHG